MVRVSSIRLVYIIEVDCMDFKLPNKLGKSKFARTIPDIDRCYWDIILYSRSFCYCNY